jgi:hypothetical protein
MANVNAPFGLKPVNKLNSGVFNAGVRKCYIPSTYGTALYVGDPVVKTGTSNTTAYKGTAAGVMNEVNKATAGTGNKSTGVIVAFDELQSDATKNYNPANTERVAYVLTDPYAAYWIQDDGSATLTAGDVGANFNMTFSTGGSTTSGQSGVQLDASSTATTATLQLNIIGLADIPGNALGANAIWEVKLNAHTESANSAGI